MCVFRIGKERNSARFAFLYLCKSVDSGVLVTLNTPLDKLGYLLCCKLHNISLISILLAKILKIAYNAK